MRRRDVVIYGSISLVALGVVAYLPIVVVWSSGVDAQSTRVQSITAPLFLDGEELTAGRKVIVSNWFIEQAPSLYIPLLKTHARFCGFWLRVQQQDARGKWALIFAPIRED
jgi:hypothetical protein